MLCITYWTYTTNPCKFNIECRMTHTWITSFIVLPFCCSSCIYSSLLLPVCTLPELTFPIFLRQNLLKPYLNENPTSSTTSSNVSMLAPINKPNKPPVLAVKEQIFILFLLKYGISPDKRALTDINSNILTCWYSVRTK